MLPARLLFPTLGLALLPVAAACSSLDRFDTKGSAAYCGSLVASPRPFEEGLLPKGERPSLSMRLELDIDALNSRGEQPTIVGQVTTDDADRGLCSASGSALFSETPLRTIPALDHDPLSALEFGTGRDYNFFAWVDSSCQNTMLALVSLMRNEDVEVRLLKPATMPKAGAPPEQQPGFGIFYLKRERMGCSF